MNVNYDYYRIFYYVAKCGNLAGGKRAGQQPAEPDALDQKISRRSWAARSFPGRTAA